VQHTEIDCCLSAFWDTVAAKNRFHGGHSAVGNRFELEDFNILGVIMYNE